MKKITLFFMLLLYPIVGLLYYMYFSEKEKIAYIDSVKILYDYSGMKKAKEEYTKKSKVYKANVDSLTTDLESDFKLFEKKRVSLSEVEIREFNNKMKEKQMHLGQYQEAISNQLRKDDEELTNKVVAEIDAFIKDFGKENNYTFIIGANSSGNLVYAEDTYDLTDEVLNLLNDYYNNEDIRNDN